MARYFSRSAPSEDVSNSGAERVGGRMYSSTSSAASPTAAGTGAYTNIVMVRFWGAGIGMISGLRFSSDGCGGGGTAGCAGCAGVSVEIWGAVDGGLWIVGAIRKCTIHVLAVNPYGGKLDHRNHLEGRMRNVDEVS
jgi:hypothetical protein